MKHYLGVLSISWYIHRKRSSSSHIQTLCNAALSRQRPPTPLRLAIKPLSADPPPPAFQDSGSIPDMAWRVFLLRLCVIIYIICFRKAWRRYTHFYILILISWSHGFYHATTVPKSAARWASLLSSLHPSRSHWRRISKSSENTSKKASQYLKCS